MNLIKDQTKRLIPPTGVYFSSVLPLSLSFDDLIFYFLLTTVFLTAIPYGTVDQWYKAIFVLAACLLASVRLINSFLKREFYFRQTVLLIPLLSILILACAQTIPFPFTGGEPLSDDPYYTADFIILFAAVVAVFEMLLFYTTTLKRLRLLVALVLAIGGCSALFGIARELLIAPQPSFINLHLQGEVGFAQFINRNHFVFLLEMTIGLLTGILMKSRMPEGWRFGGWVLACILIFACIAVNSRGGILSLAGLMVIAIFLHLLTKGADPLDGRQTRQTKKNWIIKITAAAGAAILVFGIAVFLVAFVGGDAVVSRMEQVSQEIAATETEKVNRSGIWRASWELIKDRPLAGAGFGAYGVAITRFDQTGGRFSLQQAHNDYLELLAGGGILALVLASVFAGLVLKKSLAEFDTADNFRRAACFGAALGMIGVLLHSLVDFGLHVVNNALVFVVLIVIAVARVEPTRRRNLRKRRRPAYSRVMLEDYQAR